MRRSLVALALVMAGWAAPADAAYTWRTSTKGQTGASIATFTVTEPASAASGDWEFVLVATEAICTVTTPSGWTQLFNASGTNAAFYVLYVTGGRGGSAPGLIFTVTNSAACDYEWHGAAVAGSNVTIDASAAVAVNNSSTNPNPPSASATLTTDEAIAVGWNWAGATFVAPSTYTLRSVNTAGDGAFASKDLSASGPEDPAVFTGDVTANNTYAVTILLQPSGAVAGARTRTVLGVGKAAL